MRVDRNQDYNKKKKTEKWNKCHRIREETSAPRASFLCDDKSRVSASWIWIRALVRDVDTRNTETLQKFEWLSDSKHHGFLVMEILFVYRCHQSLSL